MGKVTEYNLRREISKLKTQSKRQLDKSDNEYRVLYKRYAEQDRAYERLLEQYRNLESRYMTLEENFYHLVKHKMHEFIHTHSIVDTSKKTKEVV